MKEFKYAFKISIPIIFTYIFVGLGAGLLLKEAGYGIPWVILSAAIIYSGSIQILMVPLMLSHASIYTFIITTLLINARHTFYAISFIDKFKKIGGWRYPFMVLTVTDENFSALCNLNCPETFNEKNVSFFIFLICYISWFFGNITGAVIGEVIPFDMTGIDFAVTLFFTTVVIDQYKSTKNHMPLIIGIVSALLFLIILGPDKFLMPSLISAFIVLILTKDFILYKERKNCNV